MTSPRLILFAGHPAALMLGKLGRYDEGVTAAHRSIEAAEKLNDGLRAGHAYNALSYLCWMAERYAEGAPPAGRSTCTPLSERSINMPLP